MLTVTKLREILSEHIHKGRGDFRVMLDRRGVKLLRLDKDTPLALGVPPPGEEVSKSHVYLHVKFDAN